MKILVTGANGFIGKVLSAMLIKEGYSVRCTVHFIESISREIKNSLNGCEIVKMDEIGQNTDWHEILGGVEAVVHLAARTPVMKENIPNPLTAYRKINVGGTESLARAASNAGIGRFIYVSSIGVNGSQTLDRPFTEKDSPNPRDNYALSKWEAEQILHQIVEEVGLNVVIIRPSLVYGPGVKENLLRLLQWIYCGVPLPLTNIDNLRSLIGVDNLADLLVSCIENPNAVGETFLAADGEDLSTPELIRRLANMLNRPTRLFPFPKALLNMGARLLGKRDVLDRLCGSLVVDVNKARQLLNWRPKMNVNEGLAQMAEWYLSERVSR